MKKITWLILAVLLSIIGGLSLGAEKVKATDRKAMVQNVVDLKVSTDRSSYSSLHPQIHVKMTAATNETLYYTASIRKLTFPVTSVYSHQGSISGQAAFTAPTHLFLPSSGSANYDVHVSLYKDASRTTLIGYYVANSFTVVK
ncbi:hypothetical protein IEE86_13605 [Bacillus sp. 28A-2]|uniref:hypothetical protein n=1 Tax=Bacillus sp. 28A-2 TaxID=2772252 RepID=UPI00168D37EB|nr:hypothetical protein [Bacillus sp. 28A-2]MBD3860765.1 hypothetical protein [Bacillus sp. 28A-2]